MGCPHAGRGVATSEACARCSVGKRSLTSLCTWEMALGAAHRFPASWLSSLLALLAAAGQ